MNKSIPLSIDSIYGLTKHVVSDYIKTNHKLKSTFFPVLAAK